MPVIDARIDVQHPDRLDARFVEDARLDHRQRTARAFFRRLKDQYDGVLRADRASLQYARRAKQHCCMRVVPARMHLPVHLRCVRYAAAFGDRQGVHIRAQPAT